VNNKLYDDIGGDIMASKLRREKDLISRTIDKYKETTMQDYARYFEGSPTYITYYQLDDLATQQDGSLENVHSLLGKNSPNFYNKIEDVVIYGVDALDISNELNEKGLQSLITGDFVLLPDSIRPYPGDFFVFIDEHLQDHLFRIDDVQYDKASPRKFFRCSYAIYQENASLILDNIQDEYILDYDNIAGQSVAMVKKSSAELADKAKLLVDSMIERYQQLFYNEDMDAFVVKVDTYETVAVENADNETIYEGQAVYATVSLNGLNYVKKVENPSQTIFGYAISTIAPGRTGVVKLNSEDTIGSLWSPYLQKFMYDTNLMEKYTRDFMKEIYIGDIREDINPQFFSDEAYFNSIFRMVKTQQELKFQDSFMNISGIDIKQIRTIPFFHAPEPYRILSPYENVGSWPDSFHILYQNEKGLYKNVDESLKFDYNYTLTSEDLAELADGTVFFEKLNALQPNSAYRISGTTPIDISFNNITQNLTGETLFNIVLDHTKNRFSLTEVLITSINNTYFAANIKNYIFLPLVIHIIKDAIANI
jgi:hypothetical protein